MVDYAQPLPTTATANNRNPPEPPKTCNKLIPIRCNRPATHLFAVVDVGVGPSRRRRSGALGEFTLPGGELREGIAFVGWCSRCPECLRDDLEELRV